MKRRRAYKFRVIEEIGDGGFGYVERIELYNKTETHSGLYARKVLSPKSDLKLYNERFRREVLSQCICYHNNVVPIYICKLSIEKPFFIMELAEIDLQKMISNKYFFTEEEKIDIIKMVLLGVNHIHKKGFLHRDIKPGNILKYPDGTFKVSDFGLVRRINVDKQSAVLTSLNVRLGTDQFFAPELLYEGHDYSERSDIFAMGKVFELLNVSAPEIRNIITKCTKFDPADRYDSVENILCDFEQIAAGALA